MRKYSEELWLEFLHCEGLGGDSQGAARAADIVSESGGRFLVWVREQKKWGVDEKGLGMMEADWFAASYFSHPVLARSLSEHALLKDFDPVAGLSFLSGSRTLCLGQGALQSTPQNLDDMARGQLAFAQLHYPHLRPRFGYIDEMGRSDVMQKLAKRSELRNIYWANFWGPDYIQKYGRDFLLNAPGWKKEELDDGGILYVVTESYYDWWTKPPKDVLEYFRAQVPGIKLYRARKLPDF